MSQSFNLGDYSNDHDSLHLPVPFFHSFPPSLPPFFFFCWEEEGGSEVEKDSFIAFPDKRGPSGLMPSKPNVPTWGR